MNCKFENNEALINKIFEKGFENKKLPVAHTLKCECEKELLMKTCITKCNSCNRLFGVTPCGWEDPSNIVSFKN